MTWTISAYLVLALHVTVWSLLNRALYWRMRVQARVSMALQDISREQRIIHTSHIMAGQLHAEQSEKLHELYMMANRVTFIALDAHSKGPTICKRYIVELQDIIEKLERA